MTPGTRFVACVRGEEQPTTCVMLEGDEVEVIDEVRRRILPIADIDEDTITDQTAPADPELAT